MKRLSKFFGCAAIFLLALGIIACDDKKPSGVKVTSEQWNKSMTKLADKGKITTTNISSSLKDGEETTPTYGQLVMTNGGVKIAQKTQIKNNKK